MAKIITTVAKYTESHDRLTLNVKFKNGDAIRLNASRYRDSLSGRAAVGTYGNEQLQKFFNEFGKNKPNENPGQRFARAKMQIEKADSFAACVAAI